MIIQKCYRVHLKSGNSFKVWADGVEFDIESELPKFFNLSTNIPFIDWEQVEAIVEEWTI